MKGILYNKNSLKILGIIENVETVKGDIDSVYDTDMLVETTSYINNDGLEITIRPTFDLFQCDFVKVKNNFEFNVNGVMYPVTLGMEMPYVPEKIITVSEIQQLQDTVAWLLGI